MTNLVAIQFSVLGNPSQPRGAALGAPFEMCRAFEARGFQRVQHRDRELLAHEIPGNGLRLGETRLPWPVNEGAVP